MGRRAKNPPIVVAPVRSKKQLLGIRDVCTFLGGISADSLNTLRRDGRFPQPLQLLNKTPMWSVEQLERYVGRKEKEVERITA